MKKTNLLILTITLAIVFLGIEIVIVRKAAEYEPKKNTVYASVDIKPGEIINEEMLEIRETRISNIHEKSFQNKEDIVGKKAKNELFGGEMILQSRILDTDDSEEIQVLTKGNRLFTVEFKSDQVNGWWLKEGQYVDIIFIPSEKVQKEANNTQGYGNIERVRNVRIAAIIDDKGKLVKDLEKSSTPQYISFEVNDKLDEFLAFAKSNGRLEVSAIPANETVSDF